jgi:hypothetical protein
MKPSNPEDKLASSWFEAQVLAAGRTLEGSDEWAFRRITREYAQKFNVSLEVVRSMPFKDVLLEVLESRLDSVGRKDLMEFVRELLNDESAEAKAQAERFKRYEEQEKERLARQKARKPKVKKQKITALMVPPSDPVPVLKKTYSLGDPDKE